MVVQVHNYFSSLRSSEHGFQAFHRTALGLASGLTTLNFIGGANAYLGVGVE